MAWLTPFSHVRVTYYTPNLVVLGQTVLATVSKAGAHVPLQHAPAHMFCRANLGGSTSEGVRIYLILHLILNPQLWHAGIPTLGTGYAWPLTSTIKGHLVTET